jgi:hypothetical protein
MSMSNKDRAEKAADAMVDLTMLYAVKYLCENSLFRSPAGRKAADRLIKVCDGAAQKQLEDYDRNLEAIKP